MQVTNSLQVSKSVKGDSYYGKVAENYEFRRSKQAWWSVEHTEMADLLRTLPRGLSVLDVPFGTGRYVPLYLEQGFKVCGLDASEAMLAQAARQLGPDFKACKTVTGTATALPYEDGAFDLVVSTRFLRDIISFADAKKALAEFGRVTRKYAIIQLGQSTAEQAVTPVRDEAMGSKLSARQNRRLLASAGFRVIDRRLVKEDPDAQSEIYHFLCKKV